MDKGVAGHAGMSGRGEVSTRKTKRKENLVQGRQQNVKEAHIHGGMRRIESRSVGEGVVGDEGTDAATP